MQEDRESASASASSGLSGVFSRLRRSLFGEQGDENAATERPDSPDSPGSTERREPLTDRGVVERMLDTEGGRIKQSVVISRTDWSASKVSRLLSSMEKRGRIDRIRVGRQKVVVDRRDRED